MTDLTVMVAATSSGNRIDCVACQGQGVINHIFHSKTQTLSNLPTGVHCKNIYIINVLLFIASCWRMYRF